MDPLIRSRSESKSGITEWAAVNMKVRAARFFSVDLFPIKVVT